MDGKIHYAAKLECNNIQKELNFFTPPATVRNDFFNQAPEKKTFTME